MPEQVKECHLFGFISAHSEECPQCPPSQSSKCLVRDFHIPLKGEKHMAGKCKGSGGKKR